ncbi:hypothetical protein AVEN_49813-1 [Araneus ventricosus]|uniref:Uncharacterized protein n=1 Tax=Araneus ventricosus TaxID=182803 RepID=A0A4Y2JLB7_ARAVE|nr:hypothetical protein AVEN_49813-1 [Araneus ventricosus]
MRYGSLDDFQEGAKIPKSGLSGKQGSAKVQPAPGPVVQPYVFGQRNPFELQPLGVAPSVSKPVVSDLPAKGPYVGFGLSLGLPPGTKWGDTPYSVVDGDDEGSKVEFPGEHPPAVAPVAICPPVSAAGHKRKKEKGKRRTQKLSRGKKEGSIDSSLLNRSSTDSDKTVLSSPHKVLAPDTPAVADSETDTSEGEVPDTPVRVRQPGSYFERLCPEIQAAVNSFVAQYPGDANLVKHIWVLMYAIDAQFVGLRKRVEELEATVVASAIPADKSFAQAVGPPRPVVLDVGTDPPELLGVSSPGRVPQQKKRRGPTLKAKGSGNNERIADPSPGVLQEGVVAPQLVSRPRAPQLPSRQSLNAHTFRGGDCIF